MMKKLCLAATLLLSLIGALTLSAAPSKQIMSLEYFYAKDGTITGRSVNGRMQTYQYDKRGQLLAVVDSKGQAVEKYVYDRAGNILEKTVNGVTTTYTYDKANQLVSSTVEGKVTSYRYDAAGRLVKEGDKSYRYGYLDKVLAVYENGENTANFDYHLGGQIASATRNGETENFTWDGLALIHRGSSTFINEPYVTGGNPLLSSKSGVMFNDMLGSTLGLKDGSNLETASMSAFGETADNAVFFTGKPKVDELGYAFLFRNYRAEQGKWQTSDPLGYPDGWNNLAYVNNGVSIHIDALGLCRTETHWKTRWEGDDLVLYDPVDVIVHDIVGTLSGSEKKQGSFLCTLGCSCGTGDRSKSISVDNQSQVSGTIEVAGTILGTGVTSSISYSKAWGGSITDTITLPNPYNCPAGTTHTTVGEHRVDYYAYVNVVVTVDVYKCGAHGTPNVSLGGTYYDGKVVQSTKCVTE